MHTLVFTDFLLLPFTFIQQHGDSIPLPWGLKPKYSTTLATEARLGISLFLPYLCYYQSVGFASGCPTQKSLRLLFLSEAPLWSFHSLVASKLKASLCCLATGALPSTFSPSFWRFCLNRSTGTVWPPCYLSKSFPLVVILARTSRLFEPMVVVDLIGLIEVINKDRGTVL